MPKVYIAGPMRGLPNSNFAAFDAARNFLEAAGYQVLSPADADRDNGDDPKTGEVVGINGGDPLWVRKFVKRDLGMLMNQLRAEDNDAIAILPGCDKSTGCPAEVAVARWLKLKFLSALSGRELLSKDPIAEVNGEALNYQLVPEVPAIPARWEKYIPQVAEEDSCGCGVCAMPGTESYAIQQIADRMANTAELPEVDPDSPFMRRVVRDNQCKL